MVAFPRNPGPTIAGLRTLGTAANEAASGADSRFLLSGALTVKATYLGTPGETVFYTSMDLSGNVVTDRTTDGVEESVAIPGLYSYDQVVSLDQFIAKWDEGDTNSYAAEVIATRHVARAPNPPTSIVAVGGDAIATISFTPGDNGGAAVSVYNVTAIDATTPANGGQTASASHSPAFITGLTNGDTYTFTVTAVNVIGESSASLASNSVTPAVVLYAPDAPTSVTATVAGSGSATVHFTPPDNNGGSPVTSYKVTATDETTSGNGGQTRIGTASPLVVTGLVNGDACHFTAQAINAIGTSIASAASNTISTSGSGGIATFTYSQPGPSSIVVLDATGSSGTLTWSVDGVDSVSNGTALTIGPLTVGNHVVRLTAVSGGAGITTQTIPVAWVAKPMASAQFDNSNGVTTQSPPGYWGTAPTINPDGSLTFPGLTANLPKVTPVNDLGPWRTFDYMNMAQAGTAGDGVTRITALDDNHIRVRSRFGDHQPGSGGYRAAMTWNSSYDANQNSAGYEFHRGANQTQGIDATGMGTVTPLPGHGALRFFRCSFLVPSSNPTPLDQVNNFFEFHSSISGGGPITWGPAASGLKAQWGVKGKVNGVDQPIKLFDSQNIIRDVWYDYVLEFIFDMDPSIGYVRIYRDFGQGGGMAVLPLALCPTGTISTAGANYGKYFAVTGQTDQNGIFGYQGFNLEVYRTKATLDAQYVASGGTSVQGDVTVEYKNFAIGPSFDSVMRI